MSAKVARARRWRRPLFGFANAFGENGSMTSPTSSATRIALGCRRSGNQIVGTAARSISWPHRRVSWMPNHGKKGRCRVRDSNPYSLAATSS